MQELTVQAPDMEHERFYVKKEGLEFQPWEKGIYAPGSVEAFIPDRNAWINTDIEVWPVADGSGNAPAANAHYFLKWRELGVWMKYDLHAGLKVRLLAPTDEELVKRSGRCEGVEWTCGDREPSETVTCGRPGEKYRGQAGQAHWFCEEHKPDWAKLAE
jgi:hypothetical protein